MLPFNIRPAGGSIGGILRKGGASVANSMHTNGSAAAVAAGEARQVDLLVFGYACKVFRDDDKARDIDQGKHLIPWMDSNLKIDRYDVRGALSELAAHEPPPGGYGNRLDYLSAEEQRAEQLCEEERYLYLYNSEEEHILQQEEDLKRLKQESSGSCGTYNQVAFQYDAAGVAVQHGPSREEHTNSPSCEEGEQPFQLPEHFEVPAYIQLPETMKQHAIIEKTAHFIASQGVQMEVLLKAKQSNNAQFEFLSLNSLLNPYYKFVMNAIKNGTYPAATKPKEAEGSTSLPAASQASSASCTFGILASRPVIAVPTIKYKPSANCAYTQLISKIKGVPLPSVLDENASNIGSNSPTTNDANGANFTPVLLQYNGNTFVTAESEELNSNSNSNSNLYGNSNTSDVVDSHKVEILKTSSALALAQDYSSDSESDQETVQPKAAPKPEPILNFPIPTDNLKNIIDKTATYVIKNGRQFEETLRTKSEERFTFLIPDNEYYAYYMYKIKGDPDAASKEQKTRKAAAVAAALLSKKGLTSDKTTLPVSFSIKPKDEYATGALLPALPQEPSDDEESERKPATDASQAARTVPEHVQKAIQLVENQLMARNAQLAAAAAGAPVLSSRSAASSGVRSRFDLDYNQSTQINNAKTHVKNTKAELERNALYEQQQQHRQKELKKAEEKVKDKLAQIAREKLGGLISKEKQLQMERKRKAMAFLNQIKGTSADNTDKDATPEPIETKSKTDENTSDDSDASVHSIPITSFGPDVKTEDEEEEQVFIASPAQKSPAMPPPDLTVKLQQESAQREKRKLATVTVSDDDDVQVVSETKPTPQQRPARYPHKGRRRSSSRQSEDAASAYKRQRRANSEGTSESATDSSAEEEHDARVVRHSKAREHKPEKSKSKPKSSGKSRSGKKKKSKKRSSRSTSRQPSKSHRRSRSRQSRSCSEETTDGVVYEHRQRHRHSKPASHAPPKLKDRKRKHVR